jgi:hypothetical protein
MKFTLEIETSNDAFSVEGGGNYMVAAALRNVARQVEDDYTNGNIKDTDNGSKVGTWKYVPEHREYPEGQEG